MPLAVMSELRFSIALIAHIAFVLLICLSGLLLVGCQKEKAPPPRRKWRSCKSSSRMSR